ncbi:hypothetical protein ACIRPK_26530 [Kitasatospora sp. NPDC101801]|uniref:hypothetical protein n=1 Tax=Kitasatospora sp. NPDC101801 TaxID=3364103 RepID=UPI003826849B
MNNLLDRAVALAGADSPSARTICVDFDGVIHPEGPWNGGRLRRGPLPGAVQRLRTLLDGGWCLAVVTARHSDFHEDVATWLGEHLQRKVIVLRGAETAYWNQPGVVLVTNVKVGALVYVDDKAEEFTSWATALAGLPDSPDDLLRTGSPAGPPAPWWQRLAVRIRSPRFSRKR